MQTATDLEQPADVAVVGAGIVGLATALRLQLEGRRVLVIDHAEPGAGCSGGNAGYLSEGNFFPIASPDVIRSLPKMLFDRTGPLVIRASHLPRLVPWGLRLLAASRPEAMARSTEALVALTRPAIRSFDPLLEAAEARDVIDVRGGLHLYRTTTAFEHKAAMLPMYADRGIAAERLTAGQVRDLEPAISGPLAGAIYFPNSARCVDPALLATRFAAGIVRRGGSVLRTRVTALRPLAGGQWTLLTDGREISARRVVVAAGRWSDALLQPLGYRVPLESERGYHLMLPSPQVSLTRPLVVAERHFAVTPMIHGLRIAGTVEFADLDAPMDPSRSDMLFEQAVPLLAGLSREGATRWMGHRPSLPDSIPAIGRAAGHENLFYNFGHHHSGLTLAAISAHLLADIVAGRPAIVDPEPYDLRRFGMSRWT